MALVNVISIGIKDFVGNRKTVALFTPATLTLANLQTLTDNLLPDLDAVIDGQIVDVSVQLALTVVAGLKSAPVAGNTVREGANLTYDAANTDYAYSVYIPSWENAGFAGDAVLVTTPYDALEGDFTTLSVSDRDGNALTSFSTGKRTFRK